MSETEYDRSMRQAGKQVRDTASQAAGVASDLGHRVGEAAAEAGQQVYEGGQRVGKGVIEQVENQPVVSVLVAAAAGFIAGILLARR